MSSIPGVGPYTPAEVTVLALEAMRQIGKSIERALVGRFVRVKSDHNGQPYGRSHKSWRGEICRIKAIDIDLANGISLQLEGHEYGECFIAADEVEFI